MSSATVDAAFEQVDDLFLARVLQHFQAGDGDGAGGLLDSYCAALMTSCAPTGSVS